jgi:hypothetical protein
MKWFLCSLLLAIVGIVAAEDAPLPLDHPEAGVSSITSNFAKPTKNSIHSKKVKSSKKQTSSEAIASGKTKVTVRPKGKSAKGPIKPSHKKTDQVTVEKKIKKK